MKNKIPRILKIDKQVFGSLRGNYQLVKNFKFVKFSVTKLNKEFKKWKNTSNFFQLVDQEIKALEDLPNSLYEHPFWKQEETYLLDSYIKLHVDFMEKMKNSKYFSSRNTVSTSSESSMTFLQRHNQTLFCISRTCDISLGFLADLRTLYLIAKKYNLKYIEWTITTPHIYTNNIKKTKKQFFRKIKIRNLIFNTKKQ